MPVLSIRVERCGPACYRAIVTVSGRGGKLPFAAYAFPDEEEEASGADLESEFPEDKKDDGSDEELPEGQPLSRTIVRNYYNLSPDHRFLTPLMWKLRNKAIRRAVRRGGYASSMGADIDPKAAAALRITDDVLSLIPGVNAGKEIAKRELLRYLQDTDPEKARIARKALEMGQYQPGLSPSDFRQDAWSQRDRRGGW